MSLKFEVVDRLPGSHVTYVTQRIGILNDVARILVSVFRGKNDQFYIEKTYLAVS